MDFQLRIMSDYLCSDKAWGSSTKKLRHPAHTHVLLVLRRPQKRLVTIILWFAIGQWWASWVLREFSLPDKKASGSAPDWSKNKTSSCFSSLWLHFDEQIFSYLPVWFCIASGPTFRFFSVSWFWLMYGCLNQLLFSFLLRNSFHKTSFQPSKCRKFQCRNTRRSGDESWKEASPSERRKSHNPHRTFKIGTRKTPKAQKSLWRAMTSLSEQWLRADVLCF